MSDKNREELKKKATAYHEEAQSSAAITEPASGSPVRARGDTVQKRDATLPARTWTQVLTA